MRSLLTVSAALILLISAAPLRAAMVIDDFSDGGLEQLNLVRVWPGPMPPYEEDYKTGIATSIAAAGARAMVLEWVDGAGAASLVRTGGALNWTNSSGVETDAYLAWGDIYPGGSAIGNIPHTSFEFAMNSNVGGFDWELYVLDGDENDWLVTDTADSGDLNFSVQFSEFSGIDFSDISIIELYMEGTSGLLMSADSLTAVGSIGGGVIPEPGTLTMALIGCACVGFVRRRRQPLSV